MQVEPSFGFGPDLWITGPAQPADDNAAQQCVKMRLAFYRVPGHLPPDPAQQLAHKLVKLRQESLVGQKGAEGDKGSVDLVPDNVVSLVYKGLQQLEPFNGGRFPGRYKAEEVVQNVEPGGRELKVLHRNFIQVV